MKQGHEKDHNAELAAGVNDTTVVQTPELPHDDRELFGRADSYLSLLWYRYTNHEAKADFQLSVDIERTIADLRRRSLGR